MRFRVTSAAGLSLDSNDPYGIGYPKVSDNFEIREKIINLKRQMTNIEATKEIFLKKFYNVNTNIENTMRNIILSVRTREQKLKIHLQEIGNAKVSEWDRQLKLCKEAEEYLKNIDESFFKKVEAVRDTYNTFAGNIGFIDAGEIKFQVKNENLLNDLKNFGKLLHGSVKQTSVILCPKFLIEGEPKLHEKVWQPWGVCTDATGRILVTDCGNDRIQAFNEYGQFLFQFGKSGSGPGEFSGPSGITVDKKCRIIVSDKNNHRIQMFTFTGRFLVNFGQKGKEPGEFQYPSDVAVNEDCEIAVSDNQNYRIQLFNSRGGFVTQFTFNKKLSDPNLRVRPQGVAFQPTGSLLVTDFNSNCILLIDKNFSVVTKIVKKNSCLKKPQGIACNRQGLYAVADGKYNRVQTFDVSGNLLWSFDMQDMNPGGLGCLQGICFHPNGNLVVADFGNHRILVF